MALHMRTSLPALQMTAASLSAASSHRTASLKAAGGKQQQIIDRLMSALTYA
jgi:hypothetical protein